MKVLHSKKRIVMKVRSRRLWHEELTASNEAYRGSKQPADRCMLPGATSLRTFATSRPISGRSPEKLLSLGNRKVVQVEQKLWLLLC